MQQAALQNVDLSGLAAEQDEKLADYFITTNQYRRVRTGQDFLILGQKGSGKSAIAFMLAREASWTPLDLSPNQFLWDRVRIFSKSGVEAPHAQKYAWYLTLFQVIANWAIISLSAEKSSHQASARKFLNDENLLLDEFSLVEAIKRTVQGVAVSISSVIELSFAKNSIEPRRPVMAKLEQELGNLDQDLGANERRLAVIVDKLDEFWDSSPEANSRLIGLLLACKEVNYRYRNMKIFVFLRSDIYRTLVFADKDKFPATTAEIKWTQNSLINLLRKRITVSLGIENANKDPTDAIMVNEVIGVRGRGGKRKTLEYILDRIHERPRDLLSFCNTAQKIALSREHSLIESGDVLEAENAFSITKRDNMTAEYSIGFPRIGALIESLAGSRARLSDEVIRRALKDTCEKTGVAQETALKKLFEYEIIGVAEGGKEFYYYSEPGVMEKVGMKSTIYCIHPILRHALHTVEVRTY
jgi:adenylate kinase family enzyme